MTTPPSWFTDALAVTAEESATTVEGAEISYRAWGEPGRPVLVLVHGGAAHARWWDHIGPLLAADRRVVAVDLSGHGDSGRRDEYGLDLWAREVLAVARAEGGGDARPIVVGHSMGGFVALRLARRHGTRLCGIVVIDAPVRDITPEDRAAQQQHAFGPLRVYPSRESALARFRPVPDQPVLPYVADHVAATSIRRVGDGWSWKFDPRVFGRHPLTPDALARPECRVALFRAEHGILTSQATAVVYDRLGRVAPVVEIPAAGHHVMLDQPLALVTGLRTLVADWNHSLPDARG